MKCDYAACKGSDMEMIDGFRFCRSHAKTHRALMTEDRLRGVSPQDNADQLPDVSVDGLLLPCSSLAPLLAVLNRTTEAAA